ncbi:hydrogenase expression protein [Legionella quinlivanii]|uniref:Hydrogenase expression protein n=1 Tax=Legionella quinlivanii TaxID=45073 RepID=A0A364LKJ5_9GAMM|nr:methyltransferase [Legionella quinlivanii]RAP37126.1 hydrogenase expression protein [Legionella quinlivanii]
MKMIKSWLNTKLKKLTDDSVLSEQPVSYGPKKAQPNADFYKNYFSLIADGARLKLVEAMFNLNLFDLFEGREYVLETEIIEKLGLMPIRAKKWLHLLSSEHFLIKAKSRDYRVAYRLPEEFIQIINSDKWWGMKFFFNTWQVAAEENLSDVLRYGKVKISVSWPPKTDGEVQWLEDWMRNTIRRPAERFLESIDFTKVKSVLDIGGGDGSLACQLVNAHPHLKIAVYNLPKSAVLARENIEAQGLSQKISVVEGDFIADDAFPTGFDLLLFSRVLYDWDEGVNRKLLRMAYQALPKNGLVAICETFKENNNDLCLSAEYRYMFHDDFSPHVMKAAADYYRMLEKIGFTVVLPTTNKTDVLYYSIIVARK